MYLELRDYTKKISNEEILKNISIEMDKGKIYGIKGKNGSGKTMLMRAICGLIRPSFGQVIINGKILGRDISFPESIGVLIENPGFIGNYSGYKNLKILADIKGEIGKEEIYQTLSEVGLDPESNKSFRKYSLGMKQKLGIAAAIMEDPEIIILDEPTNALDENSTKILHEILYKHRERGALIIISSHDAGELEKCSDEIFMIDGGIIKKI